MMISCVLQAMNKNDALKIRKARIPRGFPHIDTMPSLNENIRHTILYLAYTTHVIVHFRT